MGALIFIYGVGFGQTSLALNGPAPLSFTATGEGVYNKTVIYNNFYDQFLIEIAKVSDNYSANPIDFKIDTRGGEKHYFIIKGPTGNVGIGTLNPDFKLTVNGKIKAEEMQVVVDVPADYVFEENYELKPLEEVEKFVKENKHLPGVPDAQTLISKGWQVGEMNNKLLEKVEELTLYMIELKKENEKLKERLEKLEKPK
jgi:hypothetical protein